MKIKFGILILLVTLFSLHSCTNTKIRKNADEDIKEATEYVQRFYSYVINNKIDSAINLFDETFTQDERIKLLSEIKLINGEMTEAEIISAQTTHTISNNIVEKDYGVEADVSYEKGKCKEEFHLKNINNILKIAGYHTSKKY